MATERPRISYPGTLVLLSFVFFLITTVCSAQEVPRWEVFGGYSFLRLDSKAFGFIDDSNLNGWNFSAGGNLTRNIGVVLDLSGHYGTNLRSYNYMIGPEYSFRREKSRFFVHALFGKADDKVHVVEPLRSEFTSVGRAFAGGGGYEMDLTPRITLRVVQADYLYSNTFSNTENNIRVSTGVVVHFGHFGKKRKKL